MNKDTTRLWKIMLQKEQILSEIISWLEKKGLWGEVKKTLSIKINEK